MKSGILILVTLLGVSPLYGEIVSVPADQATIMEAINVANEGDTVLVAPGTYAESIVLKNKNLTLASDFLMTGDTSAISKTLIVGFGASRLIDGASLDTTTVICGFTLTGGHAVNGGAIRLIDASPELHDLVIINNEADSLGGGLYCSGGFLNLYDVTVENNEAGYRGGGLFVGADSHIEQVKIINNQTTGETGSGGGIVYSKRFESITGVIMNAQINENNSRAGGGIYADDNTTVHIEIYNSLIEKNSAEGTAGGLYLYDVESAILDSVIIQYNKAGGNGGGIELGHSDGENIEIAASTIRYNKAANKGGGLHAQFQPRFNEQKLCNVYLNEAPEGSDMWLSANYTGFNSNNNLSLDTCTVAKPTSYHIAIRAPQSENSININHGLIEQIEQDVYVSPSGKNANSGISADAPLASISNALLKIYADEANPRTIYLAEGVYQPSNGENFPLNLPTFITLQGASKEGTILDGGNNAAFILTNPFGRAWSKISNLTFRNGNNRSHYGLFYFRGYSDKDSLFFENVEISENYAQEIIINAQCVTHVENVEIDDNVAGNVLRSISSLKFINSHIIGGRIVDNPGSSIVGSGGESVIIENSIIAGNSGIRNAIAISSSGPNPTHLRIVNSTIADNSFLTSTGISISSRIRPNNVAPDLHLKAEIINSIIWNNTDYDQINTLGKKDSIIIAYSNIKGGQDKVGTPGTLFWEEGNIADQPLFTESDEDYYSLENTSPCVNTGTDLFVWQGDTLVNISEFVGTAPDMGAIENPDPTADVEAPDFQPLTFQLNQNYPNPFNPETTIAFSLPETGQVSLVVYDILGREVETLVSGVKPAGRHKVTWLVRDRQLASGIYTAVLKAGEQRKSIKLLYLK